ncbi:MAG: S-methyl-5-thioribose-1-phosphate isomerase [Bacteroidales bacterium]
MRIGSTHYRSIWMAEDPGEVLVIDQRVLPFQLEFRALKNGEEAYQAIADMVVRGAPLIGVTAAYGLYLEARRTGLAHSKGSDHWCDTVRGMGERLISARPTAVNLKYAVDLALAELDCSGSREGMIDRLFHLATWLAEQEVTRCREIGVHGIPLIREIYKEKKRPVNILTHCNAGWLACVDFGTATAPIYLAHDEGIPVHVWVDETRPRNQGARLTAWELDQHGVPYTVIVDNAGGQLMQQGEVDMVLVGSDRTTRNGDVANKIGTYLKALAAKENGIPFYVALPSSSIDFQMRSGKEIPIEYRDESEVTHLLGWDDQQNCEVSVRVLPESSAVSNPGFDVTPAGLVTGLITERGITPATEKGITDMFKNKA